MRAKKNAAIRFFIVYTFQNIIKDVITIRIVETIIFYKLFYIIILFLLKVKPFFYYY